MSEWGDVAKWSVGALAVLLPSVATYFAYRHTENKAARDAEKPASVGAAGTMAIGGMVASTDTMLQIVDGVGRLTHEVKDLVKILSGMDAPTESIRAIAEASKECRGTLDDILREIKEERIEARVEREVLKRRAER